MIDRWELVGEQGTGLSTSGRGTTLWLMNIGSQYQFNDYFTAFGVGTSVAATSAIASSNLMMILGMDINLPIDW